ncbi:uncharacterized protein LOC113466147 [Diaphorina citri]|uniref:Uncharacterized protein LOC113466147 n=1 Tax=Diaphorina citri TaxID=121845 RepID=A0A3Q0IRX2_DIACI|nr:uncharacterized protein LOC113466147 [Diaphorina citri]
MKIRENRRGPNPRGNQLNASTTAGLGAHGSRFRSRKGPESQQGEFRAGQLRDHVENWIALGAPDQLVSLISGYSLPFGSRPALRNIQSSIPPGLSTPWSSSMCMVVEELLRKGIVAPISTPSGFLSTMFIRLKANGSPRPIFNLSHLNGFLKLRRFRLLNHLKVPAFLRPNDFLAKIDLSDAYCHLPVKEGHQRFLAFRFGETTYAWTCLPFGLASAPQAFSQLTNWVASVLRSQGIRIIVYLDDFLIAASSPASLELHTQLTLDLLLSLGWQVNFQKSETSPSQRRTFLGLVWDTVSQYVSLPTKKRESISRIIQALLDRPTWSLRTQQKIVGLLNFAAFTVPLGRLHLRPLQIAARSLPREKPLLRRPISPAARVALGWWIKHLGDGAPYASPQKVTVLSTDASDWGMGAFIEGSNGVSRKWLKHLGDGAPYASPQKVTVLSTDASDWGMGAFIEGSNGVSRKWLPDERGWHINLRELFAVRWAIETLPHLFLNRSITLLTDSAVVAGLIRKQGCLQSPVLHHETFRLLSLVLSLRSTIKAVRIPGTYNTLADCLSRNKSPPEWHLLPAATNLIFKRWGLPSIDLFASQRSAVVQCYGTLDPLDPQAQLVDAFAVPWNFRLAWVFPPPPLIPLVLRKLVSSSGVFLLVAPRWKRTFWRSEIKARALDAPIRLKMSQPVLVDLSSGLPPPNVQDIVLEVWKIRGGPL